MTKLKATTFTPVLDTSILASGDVAANPVEIPNLARTPGGVIMLRSLCVHDKDDQGTAIDLVFSTASTNLGTLNSAISIADADAANIVGIIPIAAADFTAGDLINSRIANLGSINKAMKAADNYTRLYCGIICRSGTPTYTASGLVCTIHYEQW